MARGVPSEVVAYFRAIPLFEMVSKRAIHMIVAAATTRDVKAGTVLVEEGKLDRELFVILRGEATVSRGGRSLWTLGVGDFFGEIALLDRRPRTATVTARIDMRVMVLAAAAMEGIMRREPAVARRMLAAMVKRLPAGKRSLAI
jgi:CRP/FNR family transcriptional regulator, cyclic AMP receptor protein